MKSNGSRITLRGVGMGALAALILLLLIPISPPDEQDVFGKAVWNLLHVPLFLAVTVLLRVLQLSSYPRRGSLTVCALAASLLAGLTEIAQSLTGRTPSFEDLGADLCGILLACAFLLRGSGRVMTVRLPLFLAAAGMLALAARPVAEEMSAVRAKRVVFPALIDPGRQDGLWQAQGATLLRVVGRADARGLEVRMAEGSYEGLRYAFPEGVSMVGYSGLRIETFNPGKVFELGMRMDGVGSRRQYGKFEVPEGRAVLYAQWKPDLGKGRPVRVVLFTGEDNPARTFRLIDARLVREIPGSIPAGS